METDSRQCKWEEGGICCPLPAQQRRGGRGPRPKWCDEHTEARRRWQNAGNCTPRHYGLCCVQWQMQGGHGKCPLCQREQAESVLFAKYGLSLADYDRMLAAQGGACAICGDVNPDGSRLAVDHDHACCPGERICGMCIRGLLCTACNLKLGWYEGNRNAVDEYLRGIQ